MTEEKTYVCKIVIVDPGMPNLGLRLGPAEHEYEKVDLTHQPGRERWAVIQQTMRQFCPVGRVPPQPLSFNPNHPKETNTPPPPATEWPEIILVGTVLKAPPLKETAKTVKLVDRATELKTEIEHIKDENRELRERMDKLLVALTQKEVPTEDTQTSAPRRGRPPKQTAGA